LAGFQQITLYLHDASPVKSYKCNMIFCFCKSKISLKMLINFPSELLRDLC